MFKVHTTPQFISQEKGMICTLSSTSARSCIFLRKSTFQKFCFENRERRTSFTFFAQRQSQVRLNSFYVVRSVPIADVLWMVLGGRKVQ